MTKVKFFSLFREKLGIKSMNVKGNRNINEIFEDVVKKTKAKRSLFFKGKKVRSDYILLVNGKNVDVDVFVKDSDEVSILPVLIGG